ncbi:hypothetical protein TWF694_003827 [Orbilia ellipsospora]|uniref:Uncharacterized protein n=1 Tax=Orbilia ellipsospora TaxID=2528407 RepID=A0AAV9WZA6_9PEZI
MPSMRASIYIASAIVLSLVNAAFIKQREVAALATGSPEHIVTAISKRHIHDSMQFCVQGTTEFVVLATPIAMVMDGLPLSYTNCHTHATETLCVGPGGSEVQISIVLATIHDAYESDDEHDHDNHDHEPEMHSPIAGQNCHFHAGIEHCVDSAYEAVSTEISCARTDRDYNIKLRVGLVFVILATSAIGVFGPIFLSLILPPKANRVLLVFKQFGTGVIISTAFVHLFTHTSLMFENKCLKGVDYEATPAAILMAGIFLSFFVEYTDQRIVHARHARLIDANQETLSSVALAKMRVSNEVVSVLVMEAGIVFHSLLIGLTLVVAG